MPSALEGQSNVKIRWRFYALGLGAASWAIDDVRICASVNDTLAPPLVTQLTVLDSIGNSGVLLGWQPVAAVDFSSYEILYDTVEAIGVNSTTWDATDAPALLSMATDTTRIIGLEPGLHYYFAIRTVDLSQNRSGLSNIVGATLVPEINPPQFSDPMPAQGTSWWNSLTGIVGAMITDESELAYGTMELRVDANGDGVYNPVPEEAWMPVQYTSARNDTNLSVIASYAVEGEMLPFELRIRDRWGALGYSGQANTEGIDDDWYVRIDTTPPTEIDSLAFSGYRSFTEIQLMWMTASDAHFSGYEIYYDTAPGVTSSTNVWNAANDSTLSLESSFYSTITDLSPATRYYFVVQALDSAGNRNSLSNELRVSTLGAAPKAIDDLVIWRDGEDVKLLWSRITEDTVDEPIVVDAYRLYVNTTPEFTATSENFLMEVPDTSFTVTGATQLPLNYFFLVVAVGENAPPAVIEPPAQRHQSLER
jgi:hypothetical protein